VLFEAQSVGPGRAKGGPVACLLEVDPALALAKVPAMLEGGPVQRVLSLAGIEVMVNQGDI
jgi:hypothetical protein